MRSSTSTPSATSTKPSPSASAPWFATPPLLLNHAIRDGKTVLFEGAQGTMLDIDHGTYPFVTSSSASAGGACTGTGVPPTRIQGVIGVSKAYITRVGGGPFPTEALDDAGEQIRARGNEFGAVTGRPRRCGWFDAPLLRYTAAINGFDSMVVTKLDVLDEFDQIPVCVGYRIGAGEVCGMPPTVAEIGKSSRCTSACPAGTLHLRHRQLRRTAGQGQGLPRVSGSPHGCRSGLHFHRPGAQPDHRPPRLALRKTRRLGQVGQTIF